VSLRATWRNRSPDVLRAVSGRRKQQTLVLLARDSLADVRHTRSIWRLVESSWMFDPDQLAAPARAAP